MNRLLVRATMCAAVVCVACSAPVEPSTRDTGQSGGTGGSIQGGGGTAGLGQAGTTAGGGGSAGIAGSAGTGGAAGAGGTGSLESLDAQLYRVKCVMCHGPIGVGLPDLVPPLGPEIQHPIRDYARWVVRNGLLGVGYKEPMELWLAEADPLQPEALIVSITDLELIFDFLDKPPKPTTGQGLYMDYCGNCHGADGKSGSSVRDITTTEALALFTTVVRAGAHLDVMSSRTEYMPAFDPTILTDAELQLVLAHVTALAP